MTPDEFFHWFARHGAMPQGARPEDYEIARDIAWKAYLRGMKDQNKSTKVPNGQT